jgi:hypothetical protein
MGYVCQGKQLHNNHPFFSTSVTTKAAPTSYVRRKKAKIDDSDDDIEGGVELFDVDAVYDDAEDNDVFDETQLDNEVSPESLSSESESGSDSS